MQGAPLTGRRAAIPQNLGQRARADHPARTQRASRVTLLAVGRQGWASLCRLVSAAHAAGGRVIAVGTTVARALESAADSNGVVRQAVGWTDLVLGPGRPRRVVDGLITGWHDVGASHLLLLEAVAGAELVATAYREAVEHGYLWHEFGDSALLLPEC